MTVVCLREELKYRGYDEVPEIIVPSKELIEIDSILDDPILDEKPVPSSSLKETIKSTKSFYKRNFRLQKVPYIFESKGIEYIKLISPLKLPVEQDPNMDEDQTSFSAILREVILPEQPEYQIVYRKLDLSNELSPLSRLAYTHEVAHTELNHIKGIIEQYYNTEVISIFLELVHAFEEGEDLLHIHDAARLRNLQGAIYELEQATSCESILIESSLYTVSTLKAYELFIKFYIGSINTKREIMYYVQRLFNQEITLEDLLWHFNISFESSQNPDLLKRYINR